MKFDRVRLLRKLMRNIPPPLIFVKFSYWRVASHGVIGCASVRQLVISVSRIPHTCREFLGYKLVRTIKVVQFF